MNDKLEGVVVRFGARGFGFILDLKSRVQYFAHINDVVGRETLQAGDRVTFLIGQARPGQNALPAIFIELVSSPDRTDRLRQ